MRKFWMVLYFVLLASIAQAGPIHVLGNECPSDAQMAGYTRQYYVTQAIACVYDDDDKVNNIQGTDAEAAYYLDSGPLIPWGDNWEGLGQNPILNGFSYTTDAGNDDGTFTIGGPLAAAYDQFAIAIKDGKEPFFAIFLLSPLTFSGDWGFRTEGGSLSHFALFGHTLNVINPNCPNPPCNPPPPPPPIPAPEPASLLLFGTGITWLLKKRMQKI